MDDRITTFQFFMNLSTNTSDKGVKWRQGSTNRTSWAAHPLSSNETIEHVFSSLAVLALLVLINQAMLASKGTELMITASSSSVCSLVPWSEAHNTLSRPMLLWCGKVNKSIFRVLPLFRVTNVNLSLFDLAMFRSTSYSGLSIEKKKVFVRVIINFSPAFHTSEPNNIWRAIWNSTWKKSMLWLW